MFIRKLETGERFGTYLRTENGYNITAPEGICCYTRWQYCSKIS